MYAVSHVAHILRNGTPSPAPVMREDLETIATAINQGCGVLTAVYKTAEWTHTLYLDGFRWAVGLSHSETAEGR